MQTYSKNGELFDINCRGTGVLVNGNIAYSNSNEFIVYFYQIYYHQIVVYIIGNLKYYYIILVQIGH